MAIAALAVILASVQSLRLANCKSEFAADKAAQAKAMAGTERKVVSYVDRIRVEVPRALPADDGSHEGWREMRLLLPVILVFAVLMHAAFADEPSGHGDGHAQFHNFYKSWKQPNVKSYDGSSISCCNAREADFNSKGVPTRIMGDCYPTEFRLQPGGKWIARLAKEDRYFYGKEWIDVPEAKILREKNPDLTGRDGHLCIGPGGQILCAVPPTGAL